MAVNITRLDDLNAEKAIPGEAKAVGAQFPDVVKVQLSEDFGPATKLLPTLKVRQQRAIQVLLSTLVTWPGRFQH